MVLETFFSCRKRSFVAQYHISMSAFWLQSILGPQVSLAEPQEWLKVPGWPRIWEGMNEPELRPKATD